MPFNLLLLTEEITAAGISHDGLTLGADGTITYRDDVEQSRRDAVEVVAAAHDHTQPTPFVHDDVSDLVTLETGQPSTHADARARLNARPRHPDHPGQGP